jgi:hypothetical protein
VSQKRGRRSVFIVRFPRFAHRWFAGRVLGSGT